MSRDKIISVAPHHIKPGIEKYKGQVDKQLLAIIKKAGFEYTPYLFKDGRVLLVLPHNLSALLYPDKETLFNTLNLED